MSATMEPRIQYAKTSDGVNIAYAAFGDGPAIVVTPPAVGGLHLYSKFPLTRRGVEGLVRRGWRVIRYDGRGSGSSDRDRSDYSVQSWVRDTEAVVDRLRLDAFTLVSSTGAASPAVAFAVERPARVSTLILRNPLEADSELYTTLPWVRAEKALRPIAEGQW